jgi:hypothetical protein
MLICTSIEQQALPIGVAAGEGKIGTIDEACIIAGFGTERIPAAVIEDVEGGTGRKGGRVEANSSARKSKGQG